MLPKATAYHGVIVIYLANDQLNHSIACMLHEKEEPQKNKKKNPFFCSCSSVLYMLELILIYVTVPTIL